MVPVAEEDNLLERIQRDASFKGANGMSLTTILYKNQFRPEKLRFHISKEVYLMMPIVIYSRKNFFLMSSLNGEIELLKSVGLIDNWKFKESRAEAASSSGKSKPPKIYTLERLQASFEILIFGCIASVLMFVLELTFSFIRK